MQTPEAWPESLDGSALPDEPLLFLRRFLGQIVHLRQCGPGRFQSLTCCSVCSGFTGRRSCFSDSAGFPLREALVCSSVGTCFTLRQADALSDLPDRGGYARM